MKKILLLIIALFYISISNSFCQNMVFSNTGDGRPGLAFDFDSNLYKREMHVSPVNYYKMPYRLLAPLINDTTKLYPLFVMLHGGGEGIGQECRIANVPQGENVCQLGWGGKIAIDSNSKYPTYAVFPQTYSGYWGNAAGADYEYDSLMTDPMRCVIEIIDNLIKTKNIDPDRIYLAGLSNGGKAAWELLERRPDLFAATTPFCGMGNPNLAKTLINNPIWNYQGGKDNNPNPFETERMYDSLVNAGGNPKRSLYEDREHWVWVDAYNSPTWLKWIYQQNKKNIHIIYNKPAEITDTAGLAIGFSYGMKDYQWNLDGNPILGANSYIYMAKKNGKYTVAYTRIDGTKGLSNVLNLGGTVGVNLKPIALAGPDIKDTLPKASITLRGSGTDSDGSINSYMWSQISGTPLTLSGTTSSTLTLTGLNAGVFKFKLVVKDNNGAAASDTAMVAIVHKPVNSVKKLVSIVFDKMTYIYDATPKTAIASVNDSGKVLPGVKINFRYNSLNKLPLNAGSYIVEATIVDSSYQGRAYATLTISKKDALISIIDKSATYNGKVIADSVKTVPGNLKVNIIYNGYEVAPVNAGIYTVEAIVTDSNYQGRATSKLTIKKATATIQIEPIVVPYDGKSKISSATTVPSGLTYGLTYDKNTKPPVNVGNYAVVANILDMNYIGSANSTLTITSVTASNNILIEGIEIFPNPTSDFLLMTFNKGDLSRLKMINVSGIQILERNLMNKTAEQIDIKNYPRGVYQMILESNNGKFNIYKIILN